MLDVMWNRGAAKAQGREQSIPGEMRMEITGKILL
jgi:hypothetical protein